MQYNSIIDNKTTWLKPIWENLPLKHIPQWLVWRAEIREGKPTKVPYNANKGSLASSTDPQTWATYEEAKAAYEGGGYDGVGFVISDNSGLVGMDIDGCLIDGKPNNLATTILARFGNLTYCEKSASGTGLRILCHGKKPEGAGCKIARLRFEIYEKARYLTLTGHTWGGAEAKAVTACQGPLNALCGLLWPPEAPKPERQAPQPVALADSELIAKARAASNGQKFAALWDRDEAALAELGYLTKSGSLDNSSLDEALCFILAFWTGGDEARIDHLFRQSALMREKWERDSYRNPTISNAISRCPEFYKAEPEPITKAQEDTLASFAVDLDGLLKPQQQAEQEPQPIQDNWLDIYDDAFLLDEDRQWIAEDFICRGDLMMLAAKSKAGKLLYLQWLIQSILYGTPFMGQDCCPALPVLYVDYEMRRGYFREWYDTFLGKRDRAVTSQYLRYRCKNGIDGVRGTLPLYLTSQWLEEEIKPFEDKTGQTGLIVIDTLRGGFGLTPKLEPNWENSASGVGGLVRPIQDFCHKTKWATIIIHHLNKTGNVSGSTDCWAGVDNVCQFYRDIENNSNVCEITLNGRYSKAIPKKVATFEGDRFIYQGTWDEWKERKKKGDRKQYRGNVLEAIVTGMVINKRYKTEEINTMLEGRGIKAEKAMRSYRNALRKVVTIEDVTTSVGRHTEWIKADDWEMRLALYQRGA